MPSKTGFKSSTVKVLDPVNLEKRDPKLDPNVPAEGCPFSFEEAESRAREMNLSISSPFPSLSPNSQSFTSYIPSAVRVPKDAWSTRAETLTLEGEEGLFPSGLSEL